MEIVRILDNFKPLEGSVLSIGSYDGIHRGHLEIVSSIVHHGRARGIPSTLITFEPHPRHVLDKRNKNNYLFLRPETIITYFYVQRQQLLIFRSRDLTSSFLGPGPMKTNQFRPYLCCV